MIERDPMPRRQTKEETIAVRLNETTLDSAVAVAAVAGPKLPPYTGD